MEYVSVSERIFQLLEEKGMTQKELSEKTGIATSTICDWRKKGCSPSAEKVQLVCQALCVKPEALLGKSPKENKRKRIITEESELWEFIELYDKLGSAQQHRILKYALALMTVEK